MSRPSELPPIRWWRRFRRTVVPRTPLPDWYALRRLRRDNEDRVETDRWGHLADVHELPRYSVIRGYCDFYAPGARILDMGCGDGFLQQRLAYRSYLGVELLAPAVERAAAHADERTRFAQGDIQDFVPGEEFDVVIFNSSLCYLNEPVDAVLNAERCLAPDGVVIVGVWDQLHRNRRILRGLQRVRPVLDATQVRNTLGMTWTVRVHRASGPTS